MQRNLNDDKELILQIMTRKIEKKKKKNFTTTLQLFTLHVLNLRTHDVFLSVITLSMYHRYYIKIYKGPIKIYIIYTRMVLPSTIYLLLYICVCVCVYKHVMFFVF